MSAFPFDSYVDPRNPQDPSDPPPEGWDRDFDTKDFRMALFGSPPQHVQECNEWEERELRRLGYKVGVADIRNSTLGNVGRKIVVLA